MADGVDRFEVGFGCCSQPVHEGRKCTVPGALPGLDLTQSDLRTTGYELGQRRRMHSESPAQRVEHRGKRRCLGDRVTRV